MNAPLVPGETGKGVKLDFNLTDEHAQALAQFCKRITGDYLALRECAVDINEARLIRSSLDELQKELAYHGYIPR